MNAENFVFWLNGYLELSDTKDLDSNQLDIVKDHLKLVFDKVTPNRDILGFDIDKFPHYTTPLFCGDGVVFDTTPNLTSDLVSYIPPGATC